jgi:hypothetical protein
MVLNVDEVLHGIQAGVKSIYLSRAVKLDLNDPGFVLGRPAGL